MKSLIGLISISFDEDLANQILCPQSDFFVVLQALLVKRNRRLWGREANEITKWT